MGLLASAFLGCVAFLAAAIPSLSLPSYGGGGDEPLYPAAPGYLLPWPGGEIQSVTQGEETSFTHNGLAAYAFDFNLDYGTVVAARSGRVAMVYEGSNIGGCDPGLNVASNYAVIDHGDGTAALYLHLAYDSVLVSVGDEVAQGQPLAVSGDTGVTCADDGGGGPAPHLHFQVQRFEEGRYFTQSLPVAFDEIGKNDGVPHEGESHVSGNYGRGKPQKIRLTPHRAERVFAPKATPADPTLSEVQPEPTAAPAPESPPVFETAAESETPTATMTETATATATETPTNTPVPVMSDTPAPAATPTPEIVDSPTPEPSETPAPEPSETSPPEPATETPIP